MNPEALTHYRILNLLGRGGMGMVYLAEDIKLGRKVALKVMNESFARDEKNRQRFLQEARAAAALNHPNIATIHAVEEEHGKLLLVMEYIEGETLESLLRRRDSSAGLPPREAANLVLPVAHALHASHGRGVIHRDIKSANVMVTRERRIKVLDFGIAKYGASTVQTEQNCVMGTLGYMSPEQARGEPTDHRTDLWSLGVILHELLTGELPFPGDSAASILYNVVHNEPKLFAREQSVAQFTPALRNILERALEKNRQRRYQSGAELATDLESFLRKPAGVAHAQASTLALSATLPAQTQAQAPEVQAAAMEPARPTRRPRRVLFAIAVAVALIAAMAYWLRPSLPPPALSDYTQLTHDGGQKDLIGTDGPRLYVARRGGRPAQMSVNGGNEVPVDFNLPGIKLYQLSSVSPDGSKLLIAQLSGFSDASVPLWSVPTLEGSPVRLGDIEGIAGAWSPDGQKLVYIHDKFLSLANADGTQTRELTSLPGPLATFNSDPSRDLMIEVSSPVWSPDRQAIAVTLTSEAQINQIWEVSADGKNLHLMFPGWHSQAGACCGSWSADGKYFIFDSEGQIWAARQTGSLLHKVSGKPVQLTSGAVSYATPIPGKEGKTLFAVESIRRGELERFNLEKRQFEPILEGISAEDAAFSEDGQWVAYVSFPEGILWRSRVDGSEKLQLSFAPVHAMLPSWSPDGTEIAYYGLEKGRPARIYEVSAQGGAPQQLMPNGKGNQADPGWSPNGDRLVFGGTSTADDANGLHILDMKTHQVSKVAGSDGMFSPRWSPDGRYLVALLMDSSSLMLFTFDNQKWTTLFQGVAGFPSWSHDGRFVYFHHEGEREAAVERVAVPFGKAEKILGYKSYQFTGFFSFYVGLGPDDSPLLLKDTGTEEVVSMKWTSP